MALFQTSRSAPPKFGCFGKLPGQGDFLSLNLDGPEAQAMASWLSDGVGSSPNAAGAQPDQVVHYVWCPERGRRTLVGALHQSSDAVGRRFPFTVFTSFPHQQIAAHGSRAILAVEAVRRRIHEIFTRIRTLQNIRDVYTTIEGAPMPPVAEPGEVLRIWGERIDAPTLRREDAQNFAGNLLDLTRLATRLRSAPELPDFAVRLQLLGEDPDAELGVWAQMLCDRVDVPDMDVAWFVRFVRGNPAAYLFHRALDPTDLGFLLGGFDDAPRAESVGFRGNGADAARDRVAEELLRIWSARPASFRTLLDASAHVATDASSTTPVPGPAAPPATTSVAPPPRDRRTPTLPPAARTPPSAATTGPATGAMTGSVPPGAARQAARTTAIPTPPPTPAPATVAIPAADTTDAGGPAAAAARSAVTGPVAPARASDAPTFDGSTAASEASAAASAAKTGTASPAAGGGPAQTGPKLEDLSDAELAARIEALAAGTLLPGRLVKAAGVALSSAAETAETEQFGGQSVLLYLEETGYAALLAGLSDDALRRVQGEIAAHGEALRMLAELARRHRSTEEWLTAMVHGSCARAPRPGAGA